MSDDFESKLLKKWRSIDPSKTDDYLHTVIRCKLFPCLIDYGYNSFNKNNLIEILKIRNILNTSIINTYLKKNNMKCITEQTRCLLLNIIQKI